MSEFEKKQRKEFEEFKKRFNLDKKIAPHFTLFPTDKCVFWHGFKNFHIVLLEPGYTKYKGKDVFGLTAVMKDGSKFAISQKEFDRLAAESVLNKAAENYQNNLN